MVEVPRRLIVLPAQKLHQNPSLARLCAQNLSNVQVKGRPHAKSRTYAKSRPHAKSFA